MEIRTRGFAWRAADRHNRLLNWHKWFAWHPVRLGEYEVRWMEWLDRKGTFFEGAGHYWWQWEYSRPTPEHKEE